MNEISATYTPIGEIALRLLLAVLFGMVIGIDREFRRRPAGLRTHMLVALAAAVFTVIALELFYMVSSMEEQPTADPIRLVEAVTAGVAFLAAGTIIQSRGTVRGLTTGAGMWLAGAIGVATGAGYYLVAVLSVLLAFVILALLVRLEGTIIRRKDDEDG